MPRQSRGPSSQPRRPSVPPPRASAPLPQQPSQTRQASTAAHPAAGAAGAPAKQGAGPGLFGTMASTAAGAVVGTSIGHALGGFFGGSSQQEAAPAADSNQPLAQTNDGSYAVNSAYAPPQGCADDVKNFRGCMDENRGDLTICGWYLDQLKACQGMAARY
ncbi:hypothetical protein LTR91_003919 [Friedmanniomyces endolithicus]|uniref:CHCH domain-containing protein n=1 Tax=Friedmanniomyces endolithicus TaxID=329885 RepID=A0A4U0UN16_9PEZI|nr:hypothetical protein LTS09_010054 [Friedmanniomyces endolithicus]KAK0266669.1 hypothetical protein LTR35_016908 [Friedmanniomyces endolithicus]KAK0272417.1 hypothetical protein LTS00_016256 [Friedmanniomyces endolithicus]KAK0303805.1 hypothetical protein LTR01_007891 [Friedmanniomyces endolithicus]KAK0314045.1 hypothetical protein LTR82_013355 [Friedmanniomyces endolithicus]